MSRSSWWLGLAIVAACAATAFADQPRVHPKTFTAQLGAATVPDGMISPWIYFNRCTGGGCVVKATTSDDARNMTSSIPCAAPQCGVGSCDCPGGPSGTWTVHEFENQFHQTGSNGTCYGDSTTLCTMDSQCSGTCTATGGTTCAGGTKTGNACTTDADCADVCDSADYEWNQVMQCLKDIYSPYNVNITDQLPPNGVSYTEDLLAGTGDDIGYPASSGVGGLAPVPCTAQGNVLTFSFANIDWGKGQDRIWNLCYVAAQESAHPMGIEHEYSFLDAYQSNDDSTCMDPMTYRTDCGGEHFFRNAPSNCGEFMERACACGGAQNDHQKLINAYGAGTSTIPAPTSTIVVPAAGVTVDGAFSVTASSGSRRGVSTVELWLNGYRWASEPGAAFTSNGQPNPSQYAIAAPAKVPNSVIDIVVKAYDDLGAETDSATVTITKVGPCSADTDCSSAAPGQECSTMHATDYPGGPGRCFWPTPVGALGDPCTYDQFCTSGECSPTTTNEVCSQDCTVGIAGTCPTGYDCLMLSGIDGFCYPQAKSTDSGCCRVDGDANGVWLYGGVAALVLGLVTRRRKRRA